MMLLYVKYSFLEASMQKYTLLEIQDGIPFYYDLSEHCGYHRICSLKNYGRAMAFSFLLPVLTAFVDHLPSGFYVPFGLLFILYPFAVAKFIGDDGDEFLPCPADLPTLQKRLPYIMRHFLFQCLCLCISLPILVYCIPSYINVGTKLNLLGASAAILLSYELIVNEQFFRKIKIIWRIKKGIQP